MEIIKACSDRQAIIKTLYLSLGNPATPPPPPRLPSNPATRRYSGRYMHALFGRHRASPQSKAARTQNYRQMLCVLGCSMQASGNVTLKARPDLFPACPTSHRARTRTRSASSSSVWSYHAKLHNLLRFYTLICTWGRISTVMWWLL